MTLPLDDLSLLGGFDSLEPAGSAGTPLLLPLDLIDEDPDQPRPEFDADALNELAQTIALRGVRQPISVRPHPLAAGRWMLNFGARRYRASKLAGQPTIPSFVDATAEDFDQVIDRAAAEILLACPGEISRAALLAVRQAGRAEVQASGRVTTVTGAATKSKKTSTDVPCESKLHKSAVTRIEPTPSAINPVELHALLNGCDMRMRLDLLTNAAGFVLVQVLDADADRAKVAVMARRRRSGSNSNAEMSIQTS